MGIKLGDQVKDRVSGFKGTAIAVTDWLYGCRSWGVQSTEMKDGVPIDVQWFEEQALDEACDDPGGPCPGSVETG